jgi:hypothetical protein
MADAVFGLNEVFLCSRGDVMAGLTSIHFVPSPFPLEAPCSISHTYSYYILAYFFHLSPFTVKVATVMYAEMKQLNCIMYLYPYS